MYCFDDPHQSPEFSGPWDYSSAPYYIDIDAWNMHNALSMEFLNIIFPEALVLLKKLIKFTEECL